MKKIKAITVLLLLLSMLFGCLTGCTGSKTITTEDMEKASRTAELLKKHSSFQYTVTYAENSNTTTYYVDKDLFYVMYPDQNALYIDSTMKYTAIGDDLAGAMYVLTEPAVFESDNVIFTLNSEETVKSCEEKDGKLYVTTELTVEASEVSVAQDGYTYNEGEYMTIDYILEADTLTMLSEHTRLVAQDGTMREYVTLTVEYDVDRPELAQTMYEHAEATENLRTLTVISDPDTDSEKTFTAQVPKGDAVQLYIPENYSTLFTDRACTQKVTAGLDRNEDATVYIQSGR